METARDILAEIELLEKIQADRKRQRGYRYFIPNPMQQKVLMHDADILLFCGGNRSGKSTLGAYELTLHLTGDYPEWYPKSKRIRGQCKAVIVTESNQHIEKVIEPKLREFLPMEEVAQYKKITGGYLNRITMKNGNTADFLTQEQDDMQFEGQDWHYYWGDEPQSKRKFDAIMRGLLDHNGKTLLTFTPLVEPWMKEELVDKSGLNEPDAPRIQAYIVDMRDNKFDIQGNPILSEEVIRKTESMWDEDTRETRVHGKFFHLRGVVYTEFGEIHQIEFEYQYPDPVISVLDPHDRQPHHVIWAILDRTNDLFIHSEMDIHCTVDELAKKIRQRESQCGYKMKKRIIDPNFGRKPLITTGRNMIQELSMSGCGGWTEGQDAKEEGRLKVKEYLHYDRTKPVSHTNMPKLFFHKTRVPNTIRSIRNHQYEEWVGKIASDRDPKEKPKDKDTHGADCVRYLCMSNPTYERMKENIYELETTPY